MKKLTMLALLLALTLGAASALTADGDATLERPDCPGKIECPLTGELVCKDRCPLGAEPQPVLPVRCQQEAARGCCGADA